MNPSQTLNSSQEHADTLELRALSPVRGRFARALVGNSSEVRWLTVGFHTLAPSQQLCEHLGQKLDLYFQGYFHTPTTCLRISLDADQRVRGLHIACILIEIIKNPRNQRERCIDDLVEAIYDKHLIPAAQRDDAFTNSLRQATFALLGILSMMYVPVLKPNMSQFEMTLAPDDNVRRQDIDQAGRPIQAFLASFGARVPRLETRQAESTTIIHLQASILNYASLSLNIVGRKISILWVDIMALHLDFDENRRRLRIFRFPSFCATQYVAPDCSALFDSILDNYEVNEQTSRDHNRQFLREILLSYRILFGQNKAARRRFNRVERQHGAIAANFGSRLGGDLKDDPFLLQLCGTRSAIEEIIPDGTLHDRAVYTRDQFPLLFDRLAKVQNFVTSHLKATTRDLWRDTSNRAEWIAFWMLLLIGILSVLASIVQIAL
ncbi:MAG: hypothetical protein Q9167_007519, partial [Letrouitia subvulpina]